MAEDTLKDALEALTATTKAGRFRELMPVIEAKVAAGVRHDEILEALNSHGFDMDKYTYKTYVYRNRKAAKKEGKAPLPSPSPAPAGKTGTGTPVVEKKQQAAKPASQPGEPKKFEWDNQEKPEW